MIRAANTLIEYGRRLTDTGCALFGNILDTSRVLHAFLIFAAGRSNPIAVLAFAVNRSFALRRTIHTTGTMVIGTSGTAA